MKRILGGTGAALAAKVLTGFAVVAFAAAGAGAATEAAISGSLNPTDWGQQVTQQVAKCKAALTAGQHGIGQCVSAFAKQHGDTVSDAATAARTNHGKDNGKNKGNDKGNNGNNGHGNGPDNGQPSDKHGKPSNVPSHS